LHTPVAFATLSDVKRSIVVMLAPGLLVAVAVTAVAAQGLPGGRPPDVIDRARGLATQPFTPAPAAPDRPSERYVPPQRVYSPTLGREVVVPPHYARDLNGQPVQGPPLIVTTPDGQNPTILPPGSLPPVDQRGAP
jgi:hypothetical protein